MTSKLRVLVLLAIPLLTSRIATTSLPPGPDDPSSNLALLDKFADRVQRDALLASWQSATEGTDVERAPIGVLPLLLLRDDEVAALKAQLRDPQELRCLSAVHSFAVRMQSDADSEVAATLKQITALRERHANANELEPLLRRLIAARKRWAWERSKLGYLELMQWHRGYDPRVAERLENEVRVTFQKRVPAKPMRQPEFSKRLDASSFFTYLGLPENPPQLEIRTSKRTAYSDFAFYAIDPPVVQKVTVSRGEGIDAHWSTLHEFGHAAMSLLAEPTSCRTTRRPVSRAVSESCAKIAERLFYAPEWLRSQDVSENEVEMLRNWERHSEELRMRRILGDVELERALYRNPDAHVNAPSWALKRNLAYEPLARVDYLLARCAQAAVYRRLRRLPGGLLGERAQHILREEVFRNATSMQFEEWFRRASGSEPDCSAWLEDVL